MNTIPEYYGLIEGEGRHPPFDLTPHRYITAIITERGVARAPFTESLRALFAE